MTIKHIISNELDEYYIHILYYVQNNYTCQKKMCGQVEENFSLTKDDKINSLIFNNTNCIYYYFIFVFYYSSDIIDF